MDEIRFQIIDILTDDISLNEDNEEFVLTFYGKTEEGLNVVCNVVGFKPYFYIRIPGNWGIKSMKSFLKNISSFINSYKAGYYNKWSGNYINEYLEIKKYLDYLFRLFYFYYL